MATPNKVAKRDAKNNHGMSQEQAGSLYLLLLIGSLYYLNLSFLTEDNTEPVLITLMLMCSAVIYGWMQENDLYRFAWYTNTRILSLSERVTSVSKLVMFEKTDPWSGRRLHTLWPSHHFPFRSELSWVRSVHKLRPQRTSVACGCWHIYQLK